LKGELLFLFFPFYLSYVLLKTLTFLTKKKGSRSILKKRLILLTEKNLIAETNAQAYNIEGGIVSKFSFARQPQNKK